MKLLTIRPTLSSGKGRAAMKMDRTERGFVALATASFAALIVSMVALALT
jgi:hypothetical protein